MAGKPDEVACLQAELARLRPALERLERMQLALDASGRIGTWDWDLAGAVVYADACFARFCSVEAEQSAPVARIVAAVHRDDRVALKRAVRACLRGDGDLAHECRLRGQDGRPRWVFARGRCHREAGRPVRLVGVAIDITERKRTEDDAAAVQANLQLALQIARLGRWDHDFVQGHRFWDARNQEIFGANPYRDQDIPSFTAFLAIVHPDDRDRLRQALRQVRDPDAGGTFSQEYRINLPGEEERWVRSLGQVFFADGRLVRFAGVTQDITDQKRGEATLQRLVAARTAALRVEIADRRQAEAESAALYNGSPIALHSLDPGALITRVSDRWLEFMGYADAAEVLGRPIAAFMTADSAQRHRENWPFLSREGSFQQLEYRFLRRTGEIVDVLVSVRMQRDAEGHLLRTISAVADVSDRKRAEDALRQAQKMEALGQLTGGIAHDFNNLLTGIAGSLELMQTRIRQGRVGDLDRYVAAATTSANRAAALTHRLLAFARRQPLDPRPTGLNELIASMDELLRRTLGGQVAVRTVLADGLWATLCDPNQLENALLNLAINARDAMPSGGRLTVETANAQLDHQAARSRGIPAGEYVALSVTDTGSGMSPEVIARAFDPFFTTKPVGQGTGLGLSMIYGFVQQSGGQVRIESVPGQGTTVRLYLPRHGDAVRGEASTPAPGPAPGPAVVRAGAGETVLVVEDEPAVRALVVEVLNDLGYAAVEAGDGLAGLRVLRSDARIDLLVTDVGLPGGLNGRQLADAARVGRPGLRVLFMTGYAENAVVGNGVLDPGMHLITKPFALGILADRLRQIIEGP